MTGFPLILSAPSGGGKTTIAGELLRRRGDLGYSVSCTTRPARDGEREGIDYYFVSREQFAEGRQRGDFAESAEVHGELYGTLRREVDKILGRGMKVVMDIDVQGTRQFASAYPESVLVFLLPPNAQVLLGRLQARGTENPESVTRRIRNAISELRAVGLYHYIVVNDDLEKAVAAVSGIVDAESARLVRQSDLEPRVGAIAVELETALSNFTRSI